MTWHFENDRPIYTQLLEQIRLRIISGIYAAGSRLPSVRELAADASVNPNTMQKALSELEQSGIIYSQRTSGRFVTEDTAMIEHVKEEIAEAEKSEMWISYADTGNEGRYLYIVRGYGRQETTGYSIEVNECYETEHTVVVRTTLLGPQKKEKTHKKKTYPYIVIKIPYTDKQIIYE